MQRMCTGPLGLPPPHRLSACVRRGTAAFPLTVPHLPCKQRSLWPPIRPVPPPIDHQRTDGCLVNPPASCRRLQYASGRSHLRRQCYCILLSNVPCIDRLAVQQQGARVRPQRSGWGDIDMYISTHPTSPSISRTAGGSPSASPSQTGTVAMTSLPTAGTAAPCTAHLLHPLPHQGQGRAP